MTASRGIAPLFLAVFACNAAEETRVAGGAGIRVDAVARRIEIDSTRVPLLDDCPNGQVVGGSGGGWGCAALESLESRLAAVEGLRGQAEAAVAAAAEPVQARIPAALARVEPRVAGEPGPDDTEPLHVPAAACRILPADAHLAAREGGAIVARGAQAGTVAVYCPMFPASRGHFWTRVVVHIDDPDGAGAGAEVVVGLKPVDKNTGAPAASLIGPERMNGSNTSADPRVLEVDLSGIEIDFEAKYYYLSIDVMRSRVDLEPRFYSMVLQPS